MRTFTMLMACASICGAASAQSLDSAAAIAAVLGSGDRTNVTTVAGITYERCRLTRVEPDGITVAHSRGIAKLKFSDLPNEYGIQFDHDRQKEQEYVQGVAQQRADWREQAQRAAAQANVAPAPVAQDDANPIKRSQSPGALKRIVGIVQRFYPHGAILMDVKIEAQKPRNWESINRVYQSAGEAPPYPRFGDYWLSSSAPLFLVGSTSGLFVGKTVSGRHRSIGTYAIDEHLILQAWE